MDFSYVDQTGYPADACKYLIKSAMLGSSYSIYAANVACLESLGILGRFDSHGCRAIHQSLGPVASRQTVSTAFTCLSRMMTSLRVKVTAQSVSYRGATPIKVWRKPIIRCPLIGNPDVIWGKARLPVPTDCWFYTIAVPTVPFGAAQTMLITGAYVEK